MSSQRQALAASVIQHLVDLAGGECSIDQEQIAALAESDREGSEILAGLYFLHQELIHREQERARAATAMEEALVRMSAQNKELEASREQLAALAADLSSPVIRVWEGCVMIPIVGMLDAERATAITERLLTTIVTEKASVAIVDITGMHEVAVDTADRLVSLMRAIRLLGARSILAGATATVALSFVQLGFDLADVTTVRNVQQALRIAMSLES
ncbi:MAG: STAS domain-containing protein [Labilithrix sp.]